MNVLHKLWAYWQHGAVVAFVFGLSIVGAFLAFALLGAVVNGIAGLFGYGMAEEAWFALALLLFPIWLPIGIGSAARYVSTDDLKPEGARLARRPL